jgi:hypothetical protein
MVKPNTANSSCASVCTRRTVHRSFRQTIFMGVIRWFSAALFVRDTEQWNRRLSVYCFCTYTVRQRITGSGRKTKVLFAVRVSDSKWCLFYASSDNFVLCVQVIFEQTFVGDASKFRAMAKGKGKEMHTCRRERRSRSSRVN